MIGAYATYCARTCFAHVFPGVVRLVPAVRRAGVAFLAAALVGMALERTVIRLLYGRPLETLLATWGISLILIQTVRTIFGAQNVKWPIRRWMSAASRFSPTGACRIAASSSSCSPRSSSRRLAAAHPHPARPVRARRNAEPAHGELRRRTHATRRHACLRPRLRHRRSRRLARCPRSAMSVPISARAISSTRSWWWCWAASGSWPGTVYAGLGLGDDRTSCWKPLVGRGAGQDRYSGLHHHLHPEASAGTVRAKRARDGIHGAHIENYRVLRTARHGRRSLLRMVVVFVLPAAQSRRYPRRSRFISRIISLRCSARSCAMRWSRWPWT